MSHFSIFPPNKETAKLGNRNTGHDQGIGIILCCFPDCSMIYPVWTVYYCPGHPSNTILSGNLKFYVGFQKVKSEPLEHCDFVDLQVFLEYQPTKLKTVSTIFNWKLSASTLTEIVILLSQLSVNFQNLISISLLISVLFRKGLTESLHENIPDL